MLCSPGYVYLNYEGNAGDEPPIEFFPQKSKQDEVYFRGVP